MAMPYPYVPGTSASLKAFVGAVDEAIAKYGYDKKVMRGWLGGPGYHFYTGLKDAETSPSTSSQNMEPNLTKEDEVMAERGEEKEGQRPVCGGIELNQQSQRAATQAAPAKPSTSEAMPSDPSRIATLADIERFKADFERRLKKLEETAFSAEDPVPEWPAERQKLLDALSKAPVVGSESGDGSDGSEDSSVSSDDRSGSDSEEECGNCGGHDVCCSDCSNDRGDSE